MIESVAFTVSVIVCDEYELFLIKMLNACSPNPFDVVRLLAVMPCFGDNDEAISGAVADLSTAIP